MTGFGAQSRTALLYIAESWGGIDKYTTLIDNILRWPRATSPKLPPETPESGQPYEKVTNNNFAA